MTKYGTNIVKLKSKEEDIMFLNVNEEQKMSILTVQLLRFHILVGQIFLNILDYLSIAKIINMLRS